ncbi:hypothetical protein [Sphingomonas sp. MS122]|uniref:hypothetical protein n=1 Tax=Sphingomonas sp. MS122 TaxID=3412683 RepID=UPI003C2C60A6
MAGGALSLAVDAEALDEWAATARPREKVIYASGPEFPRGHPAVALARRLCDAGVITLTSESYPGGRNYIAIRCAIDVAAPSTERHAAPVQEDELADRVLRRLKRAANLGLVCPTNAELARDCGLKDADAASYRMRKLIGNKLIRVEDQGPFARRIVTIIENGRSTVAGAL